MADYYFDSSALVKRYINETGSTWVCGLLDPDLRHEAFIAAITPVEIVAAITRRARGQTIAQVDAVAACTQFRVDLQTQLPDCRVDGCTARLRDVPRGDLCLAVGCGTGGQRALHRK